MYECKDPIPTPKEHAIYLRYLKHTEAVLENPLADKKKVANEKPWVESKAQRPEASDNNSATSDDEPYISENDSDMSYDELQISDDNFDMSSNLTHALKSMEKEFLAKYPNPDDIPRARTLLRVFDSVSVTM
jgi:hypothetical protein